jgi:uncharacterized protein YfiM (DUF2279 family)
LNIKHIIIVVACLITSTSFTQSKLNTFLTPSDTLNKSRRNLVVITEASVATLTLIGLNQLWFADYPKSNFHTLNDNSQWLQMDKLGHMYSTYQLSRIGASMLAWSGVRKKDQLIYGATIGFAFLTVVEVLDGFSEAWGFSWGDMAANTAGAGLFIGQELLWNEQRMTLKYSFHQTDYASQNPEKLGDGLSQEFLKDYNGQTYWLSLNLHSFFKDSKIPKWLNVAFGYGADGMISGTNETDNETIIYQDPYRQYYFSLDIDLTRINTNSHVLRTIFDVLNVLKVPFPALEFNEENGIKLHAIYF